MEKTKFVFLFAALLVLISLVSVNVSAGSFGRAIVLNNLIQNSNDYGVAWEGSYNGGRLLVNLDNSGNSGSSLSNLNVNLNEVDYLNYESYNNRNYGGTLGGYYGSYNQGYKANSFANWYNNYYAGSRDFRGYSDYGYNSGYGSAFGSNSYERLTVDNTASNVYNPRGTHVYGAYNPESGYFDWRYRN